MKAGPVDVLVYVGGGTVAWVTHSIKRYREFCDRPELLDRIAYPYDGAVAWIDPEWGFRPVFDWGRFSGRDE